MRRDAVFLLSLRDSFTKVNRICDLNFVELGRILKDEQTLNEYNITDSQTVHLVKGKTAAASGGAAQS